MRLITSVLLLCLALTGYVIRESLQLAPKRKRNFASKTRYQTRNDTNSFNVPNNCEPVHISMVIRHGTRHPSMKDVKKIDKMLVAVNEAVKESGLLFHVGNLHLPWENPFSHTHDKLLTHEGEEEMYQIAKRTIKRFPSLLARSYLPAEFEFVSSGTSRTMQSAIAFAYGLFEGRGRLGMCNFQPVAVHSSNMDNDRILRFFDVCPKYLKEVANNKSAIHEHNKFKHGKEMKNILQKVANKLNASSHMLSEKIVIGMYTACIFEVAVYDRQDTWCEVFDEEDLQVLEYLFDLKHFWKRGYGHQINYKSGCPLLVKITDSIKNATNFPKVDKKYGSFMFAHAETLQPLYALLGLFKDKEDLRADNFNEQHRRQYKTSHIVPFGANIAFVLYKCGLSGSTFQGSCDAHSMKVQVLVNEELVVLPCCGTQTECPLKLFVECFDLPCDLSSLCSVEGTTLQTKLHKEL